MKKLSIVFLSFICTLSFALGFFGISKNTSLASESNTLSVEMFMPSSPIEFYDLTSPIAVSYSNDGYLAISEYYFNDETNYTYNKVTVYNPTTKSYHTLPNHSTLNSISQIEKYGNFIFYVSQSQIYYLPVSNLNTTPSVVKDTSGSPVIVANYFSFNGSMVVCNTNNSAIIYQVNANGSTPSFQKLYSIDTFAKAGIFASDGNIYLLDNGTFKYYRASDKTLINLSTVNKDVISMAELNDYIWFTSIDGLYKIKKSLNAEAELVVPINKSATTLGYLRSPMGIDVKDNNILVADSELNCIQEINPETNDFTTFAITTESTADYRLTKSAENVILSENYVYALDNATIPDGTSTPQKRIVKVSKDKESFPYRKIDLSSLYQENPNLKIEFFTASDTHVFIYDGEFVTLYEQSNTNPITLDKVISYQSQSVTSVYYLDNCFYYSDTSRQDYVYDFVNIHKIEIPTEENELSEVKTTLVTQNLPKINGIAVDFTVDISGNIILAYKDTENSTQYKLTRIFNSQTTPYTSINHPILSLEVDFSGNVYILSNNNTVYKYVEQNNAYTKSEYNVKSLNNDTIKTLALNYRTNDCYYLGSACIYKNADNNLDVKGLSGISANNLKEKEILSDVKFISLKEGAKIFKVNLGTYEYFGNDRYFKNVSPLTNIDATRVYAVIAEIDNDYLLISYSNKITALVRKTSIADINGDGTVVNKDNYSNYNIAENNLNKTMYLSNNSQIYSKPIVDNNYKLENFDKGQKVFAIKELKFNKTSMTLISLEENGAPCGYIVSGYLKASNVESNNTLIENVTTIGSNASKTTTTTILILIISFTVTGALLLIENKLLFKEDK